jgi:hypothetical protein
MMITKEHVEAELEILQKANGMTPNPLLNSDLGLAIINNLLKQVKNIAYEPVLATAHLDCRECKNYDVDVINKNGGTARICKANKNDPRAIVNLKPTDCKDYEYGW